PVTGGIPRTTAAAPRWNLSATAPRAKLESEPDRPPPGPAGSGIACGCRRPGRGERHKSPRPRPHRRGGGAPGTARPTPRRDDGDHWGRSWISSRRVLTSLSRRHGRVPWAVRTFPWAWIFSPLLTARRLHFVTGKWLSSSSTQGGW